MSRILVKFISVWAGFGEVISDAVFDPISKTVSDIQTADLSEEELAECEILIGEYVEFDNGQRVEVLCMDDNCTYTLCPF